MTKSQAIQIWEILVSHAGATDTNSNRMEFVYSCENNKSLSFEYRFQGKLGFGGKLRIGYVYSYFVDQMELMAHVTCYKEDETYQILEAIKITNEALKAIKL